MLYGQPVYSRLLAIRIDWAFVFGSIASGKESANSDVDLMLIGDISFAEVVTALHPAQETLSREINPKVYRRDEWQQLLKNREAFIKEVLAKPRLDIIGKWNELGESGWNQSGIG